MKTLKQHLIILFTLVCCLLGWNNEVRAGNYTPGVNGVVTTQTTLVFRQGSSGTKFTVNNGGTEYDAIASFEVNTNNRTDTVFLKFAEGTFLLAGRITVRKGVLMVMTGNNSATLKRGSSNSDILFYVYNTTAQGVDNTQLHIKGRSNAKRINIDGGADWSASGSNAGGWSASKTSGPTAKYPLVYFRSGRGVLQYANFQNVWSSGAESGGGAFRVTTVTSSTSRIIVDMTDCSILNCYCHTYAAAMYLGGPYITANSRVTMTNVTTDNCFSKANVESTGGGIYRTGGNGTVDLTMTNCTLTNNKSNATGAINWNSGSAALTLSGCTIQDNYTKTVGGALALYSKATITNCTISGNYAEGNGGGIYYRTYSNQSDIIPDYHPQNGTLNIDASTTISGNESKANGGGLYILLRPINCLNGTEENPTNYTVFKNNENKQYEFHLNINGTTIKNNTAKDDGGGIYLQRTTDIYKTDLNINYGTIENNTANGDNGGGGIYVTSNLGGTVYGSCPYSLTNLNVNVGQSGTSAKANVWKNSGKNGGGIYAAGVKLVFKVYANAVIGKSDYANQANASSGQGGGVFFNGSENSGSYGSFTMYGGNIDYNTSNGNGAGVCIANGTCTFQGGSITHNVSASGNGGGFYVNPWGTGATTTINSSSANLSISSNEAIHGGGIYVNQGSLSITKSSNTLQINSNTAKTANTGHGGGIYAKGTVTVSGATISSNHAEGNCGGGIFAASGSSITVNSSAAITSNKAIDGAGLYAAGGDITITGSEVSSNTASRNGGGLYVTGSATINSGTVIKSNTGSTSGGGVFVNNGTFTMNAGTIGGSGTPNTATNGNGGGVYVMGDNAKVDIKGGAISYNTAPSTTSNYGRGGGIYVASTGSDGTSLSGGATVNNNTAQQYGGGVFVVSGKFTLSNATISANTATANDGGGVYLGGGTFTLNNASGIIKSNVAHTNGGGVYVNNGTFTMTNGTIGGSGTPNTATYGNGGGVYVTGSSAKVDIKGGAISYNTAPSTTSNYGRGGGIYVASTGSDGTSVSGGASVNNNTAQQCGGGVYVVSGKFTLSNGTISSNTATANDGGGVYLGGGTFTLNHASGIIKSNTANTNGGGVYVNNGTFTMTNGTIGGSGTANSATYGNGGGVYVTGSSAKVDIQGGAISYNTAPSTTTDNGRGGGIYVASTGSDGTSVSGSASVNNNTAQQYGGGVYVVNGKFTIGSTSTASISSNTVTAHDGGGVYLGGGQFYLNAGGVIKDNKATAGNGGGVYMDDGTFHHSGGSIGSLFASPNKAVNGGGLYVNSGIYNSTSTSAAIIGNEATGNGGGIYMYGGTCNMKGGHIGDNGGTQLNKAVNGGGLYMAGTGTFNMTDATAANSYIRGNQATTSGGGIYMEGGTCTITYGNIGASGYANTAVNGGGIYAYDGTITVNGGDVNYNSATYGGGIYANTSSTVDVTSGDINNNTASTSGGGLFVKGTVNFSNGNINNNTATTANGGGVYIDATGELNVSGSAVMTGNSVPSGQGGGVYQGGTMTADGDALTISGNTMGSAKSTSKNNVYLPDTQTIEVLENIDPTGVNLGIYTENVAVQNDHSTDIAVLSATSANVDQLEEIYEALQNGDSRITDDRHMHKPRYVTNETILYFTRLSYDYEAYTTDFSGDIDGLPQLYKYMCWVNGINGFEDEGAHPGWPGNLTADINMGEILHWVPIGENELGQTGTGPFQGTFNGNGHVIKNLTVDATSGYTNYGLFGQTKGATISNVFMEGFDFAKSSDAGTLGSIVGLMEGGSLSGSSASGSLTTTATGCVTGGLVGKLQKNGSSAGTIHSSSAMADMTGYTMGGLVGDLASDCYLYNSFANPMFTYSGSDDSYFAGGLVAENNGTVQNCYVRFTRASDLGNAKFGQIVGDNNGSVTVCYHPTTFDASISSALVNDGSVSSTEYGDVVAPYLYNHSNDNLVGSTTETLCNKLNDWVTTNNSTPSRPTCAPWKRTTAGGYVTDRDITGGNINGDYPVHRYKDASDDDLYNCVASPDGISLDYASSLDVMLGRHTSNATINLYANDDNVTRSTGTNVVVYIDENICLLQNVGGVATSVINAYTCQTLNSYENHAGDQSRWHFLSSSLRESGIGFDYGTDNVGFSWDPNPCNVNIDGNDEASLFPSDLPQVVGGYSNLRKIDLYCFYEPEYHWLNLKRNTNSHWHMNATTTPLVYNGNGTGTNGNETYLIPGKGYLVSIDQEQLLQNKGTLNNGTVTLKDVTKSDYNAWAGLLGYNLLGNPYQSYLDFNLFVSGNPSLGLESESKGMEEATYATYDPQLGGYVQYKSGSSRGSIAADGMIPPHQGFLVRRVSGSAKATATFTNAMRSNSGSTIFRGEQPAFPLINLIVTDDEGDSDIAVLELSRDNDEGAEKLRGNTSKGWLYLHHNNEDYAILFRDTVTDYQPLWFEATEAGTYTLKWNTANVAFDELTLVDNITGVKTNMLQRDSYSFEADPSQYTSRFKLVIGTFRPIHEGDDPSAGSETFAYMSNGVLVVNGEGVLEIVDVLGRIVRMEELHGSQSTIGLPQGAAGVYVLRLTGRDGVRTQKIVIR